MFTLMTLRCSFLPIQNTEPKLPGVVNYGWMLINMKECQWVNVTELTESTCSWMDQIKHVKKSQKVEEMLHKFISNIVIIAQLFILVWYDNFLLFICCNIVEESAWLPSTKYLLSFMYNSLFLYMSSETNIKVCLASVH